MQHNSWSSQSKGESSPSLEEVMEQVGSAAFDSLFDELPEMTANLRKWVRTQAARGESTCSSIFHMWAAPVCGRGQQWHCRQLAQPVPDGKQCTEAPDVRQL